MGRKKKSSGKSGPAVDTNYEDDWKDADMINLNDTSVWKKVEVDEALMYGPVGGFMGLEELDADYDLTKDGDGMVQVKMRNPRAAKKKGGTKDKGSTESPAPSSAPKGKEKRAGGFVVEAMAAEGEEAPPVKGRKRPLEEEGAGSDAEVDDVKPAQTDGLGSKPEKRKRKRTRSKKKKAKAESAEETAAGGGADEIGQETEANGENGVGEEAECDMRAWDQFDLHPLVLKGLAVQGFGQPTPIQQECIPAAIFEDRDIMGAAETGSGKTLAFALPMLHKLQAMADSDENFKNRPLLGLVLCPTRELAIQVRDHMVSAAKFTAVRVAAIVGGMAVEKQLRILRSKPHVVVATPGRLWELIKTKAPHVSNLSHLRFLVMDEADRMVEKNHFADLTSILTILPPPAPQSAEKAAKKKESGSKAGSRGKNQGKRKATADLEEAEEEHNGYASAGEDGEDAIELTDEERDEEMEEIQGDDDDDVNEEEEEEEEGMEEEEIAEEEEGEEQEDDIDDGVEEVDVGPDFAQMWEDATEVDVTHERQTMVFSATLTMDVGKLVWKKGAKHPSQSTLEMLREKLRFREGVKVCDLSAGKGLASALTEGCIMCMAKEKDYFLYYFLQRYKGRTLVFVNSIDCIRHLTPALQLLGVEPLGLHANMQQRQRLKNLDRFKNRPNSVLVATDVAARGLDIKGVQHVIHYQLPRSVELYVHRSGRTARAQEGGVSVMLLGPEDLPKYKKICRAFEKEDGFNDFAVDATYMPAIKKRVNLARKIDKELHQKRKNRSNDDWYIKAAEEMDIVLDDDLLANEKKARTPEDKRKEAELKKMQDDLRQLLREPLLPRGVNVRYLTSNTDLAGRLMHRATDETMPLAKEEKSLPLPAATAVTAKKVKTRRR